MPQPNPISKRVVVLGTIHPTGLDRLRAAGFNLDVVPSGWVGDVAARVAGADAIIMRTSRLTEAMIASAPDLKIVARYGVGFDNIDVAALTRRGIPLAVIGDVNAVPVAEHTLALMLALSRHVIAHDRASRSAGWSIREALASWELAGKTVMLIGFGRIGRQVAKRCLAFDMRVLGVDPAVSADAMAAAGCERVAEFRARLPQVDIVSLHLPYGPDTHGMIGARELALMKPSALLINAARGGLVDEFALADALAGGRLAGAGLDVLATEPPPADHPLLRSDKVVVSPHAAALTRECAVRMSEVCAANVLDAFAGRLDRTRVVNVEALSRRDGPAVQ